MDFPVINEYAPEKERGRDFMGQQSTIQTMAGQCIPSFTNATIKPRYYTFWAWAFKMLDRKKDEILPEKRWQYLWKLENALIIANLLRDPVYTGMPGVGSVSLPEQPASDDTEIMLATDNNYKTSSYSAVQYSPSIGSLKIVSREGDDFKILKYGSLLGDLLDSELRLIEGYEELIDPMQNTIKMAHLKNLMSAFSLENISAGENECLIELIEQDEFKTESDSGFTRRVQSACLFLDIIRTQLNIKQSQLLDPLWNGSYQAPHYLEDIAGAWRMIKARQFFQLSVEAYLASFSLFIEGQPQGVGTLSDFVSMVIAAIPDQEIRGTKVSNVEPPLDLTGTFGKFSAYVINLCKNWEVNEIQIMDEINQLHSWRSGAYQIHNSAPYAIHGIILQILLVERFAEFEQLSAEWTSRFLKIPRDYRLSFQSLRSLMIKCQNMLVEEGIRTILSESMLKLHLGVAQEKWIQTGNFTFRFVRSERGGYERHLEAPINRPNATRNKSDAFLSVLRYVGLWDNESTSQMVLTESGLKYLTNVENRKIDKKAIS